MADVYKRLASLAPIDSSEYTFYTSPEDKDTLISNITVANRSEDDQTFDLNVYATDPGSLESSIANGIFAIYGSPDYNNSPPTTQTAFSTDGIAWTYGTISVANNWVMGKYGNGVYVLVSNYGDTASSTDLVTWSTGYMPTYATWKDMVFGQGKFVAVAYYSEYAPYSTDGITWSMGTLPGQYEWQSVTYGPEANNGSGAFVAIADNSSYSASSTDGISWVSSASMPAMNNKSVAYGNGVFLTASYPDVASYSTDGITWASSTLPFTSNWWNHVSFGGGTFVILGPPSNGAYSTDGISWNISYVNGWSTSDIWDIAYADGTFVATELYATGRWYSKGSEWSDLGEDWTAYTSEPGTEWRVLFPASKVLNYQSPKVNSVYRSATVAGVAAEILEPGIIVPAGGSLVVKNSASLSFNAFGTQIDTPTNYKILGQHSGSDMVAYTVPTGKQALIRSINITNTSGTALNYGLAMFEGVINNSDILATDGSEIAANETITIKGGFTAEAGMNIGLYNTSSAITISVFGMEI